jgi:large subunit ribosomal protein L10
MNREQKTAMVEEVAAQIQESEAVFAIDYRGISVPQAAALRQRLTEAGARFRVVKNTLTLLAADKAGAEALKEVLEGPTAFTFVSPESGDVALAAKALAQFKREHDLLDFKGGLMNGEPLTAEQIAELARLPARDVLHGQLVGMIAAPITGLVRTLNALIAGLAIQLSQIAEQGLVGGDAPAPAEEPAAAEVPAPASSQPAAQPATPAVSDAPAKAEKKAREKTEKKAKREIERVKRATKRRVFRPAPRRTAATPTTTTAPEPVLAQAPAQPAAATAPAPRPRPAAPAPRPRPVVAAAASAARAPAAKAGDKRHVVQPGESLWSIAKDVLGGDASPAKVAREVNRLWELNESRIGTGDRNLLMAGTELRLA